MKKEPKTILDYRAIKLGQFIRLLDGKCEIRVCEFKNNGEFEVLYRGRVEYLQWTKDGCADPPCERKILRSTDAITIAAWETVEVIIEAK